MSTAYQVSNNAACMKITSDFLCTEGVHWSAKVSAELRQEKREDLLGLEAMLWHAWISLGIAADRAPAPPEDTGLTRKQRKNRRQRQTLRGEDDQARRKGKAREAKSERAMLPHNVFKCPHPSCDGSGRTFGALHGVFNHL